MSDEPEYHLLLSLFLQALAKPDVIDVRKFYRALKEVTDDYKDAFDNIDGAMEKLSKIRKELEEKAAELEEKKNTPPAQ
jgi:hypothetical protein